MPKMKPKKPMLAHPYDERPKSHTDAIYTLQPKYDGVRMLAQCDACYTRSAQLINNTDLQSKFRWLAPWCVDGELITGGGLDGTFRETVAIVNAYSSPDTHKVSYVIYDTYHPAAKHLHHWQRVEWLKENLLPHDSYFIAPTAIESKDDAVDRAYQAHVDAGFEGTMMRILTTGRNLEPVGYHHGRSFKLLKRKPTVEVDCVILEVLQMTRSSASRASMNGDALKSTKAEHMKYEPMVGAFTVRTPDGTVFDVGTGLTHEERATYWAMRDKLIGVTVVVNYVPCADYDKPRGGSIKQVRYGQY